jgi:NitT/TauT family transport system permease protein
MFDIQEFILPKPSSVFNTFLHSPKLFIHHSLITSLEAFLGFSIANILGFVIAIIFAFNKTIKTAFMPYAIALKTTPIIAMAPLLIVWAGTGLFSKVIASALICFFPVLVNTIKGLHSTSILEEDLFRSFKASKFQTFWYLNLPKSLPYIFSALKISTTLSVVGAIVGEFVGAKEGIGYIIVVSSYRLETNQMFVGIILSALIGFLFYNIIAFVEPLIIFWRNEKND